MVFCSACMCCSKCCGESGLWTSRSIGVGGGVGIGMLSDGGIVCSEGLAGCVDCVGGCVGVGVGVCAVKSGG
eukprot:6071274-Karenia_brevis.AAC.1